VRAIVRAAERAAAWNAHRTPGPARLDTDVAESNTLGMMRWLVRPAVLAFLLSPPLFAQQPPSIDAVLVIRAPGVGAELATVWREPPDRDPESVTGRRVPSGEPDALTISMPCVAGDYFVQSASRVSLPFRLGEEDCGRARDVSLDAAASVRGRVMLPVTPAARAGSASASPSDGPLVTLPLRRCVDRGRGADVGEYRLRAAKDGEFSAVVPSGCLAVGLRVAGFAPIPRTPLELAPGESHDFGTIEMRTGATVVATARFHEMPARNASVFLVPSESYEETMRALREYAMPRGPAGKPDTAGVVAFVGISHPAVNLIAFGDGGMGLAGPLPLSAGEETEVDSLELHGPSTGLLRVAAELAMPDLQVTGVGPPLYPGPINFPATAWNAMMSLPVPGRWRFELRSGGTVLARVAVEVPLEAVVPVDFSTERSRFAGRVYLGDRAVAGSLSFTRAGAVDKLADVETDRNGRFTVALPAPGPYDVVLSTRQDGTAGAARAVEFTAGREIEVRLPTGAIQGRVSFADGRAAAAAAIVVERAADQGAGEPLMNRKNLSDAATDAAGRFTVRLLEPGAYSVSAQLGARKSNSRTAIAGDGADTPFLELLLPDDDGFTVRFQDARGGPLPMVHAWLMAGGRDDGLPQAESVQADADGVAKVAAPWSPGVPVHLVVADLDYPVTGFRFTPDTNGPVALTMADGFGQLSVVLPHGADYGAMVLVGERGALVPLGLISEMGLVKEVAERGSTTLVVPALASGAWRIASYPDVGAMLRAFGTGAEPTTLRTFALQAGGSAVVDLR